MNTPDDNPTKLRELADKLEVRFSSDITAEAARQLRSMAKVVEERDLYKASTLELGDRYAKDQIELKAIKEAIAEFGYEDGTPAQNVRRYRAYATGEIELLRKGGERLKAYADALRSRLPDRVVGPIAAEFLERCRREDAQ